MRHFTFLITALLIISNVYSQPNDFKIEYEQIKKKRIFMTGEDTLKSNKDLVVYEKLIHLNLNRFIGQTVGDILQNDTIKLYAKYEWASTHPLKLAGLNLIYADGLYLEIEANPTQYTNKTSHTGKYDLEKFKKEKITKVKLDKSYFENKHFLN